MTDDRFKTGGAFDALPERSDDLESRLSGRILSGYEIHEQIGAGGMGYVLRATRVEGDFERVAAVKIVPASMSSSEFVLRFRTEVQILAKLNHPSIAQLYDAGETEEGWPYLVMEFVDGQSIDRYCAEKDLPVRERVEVLTAVCRAVRFAHTRLVVHRDLKPSNVLVTTDGKPKLLDFGIAKLLEPGTDLLTVAHRPMTPKYASPEQLLGSDITTGSDIYQLGILFLAVLGDETSIEDSSLQDAIRRAAEGQDTKISEKIRQTIPGDLVAIISQCLHADPDDRYADLNALIADLDNFLGGYPVSARRGSALYKTRKLIRRNVPATVIAALATVFLVGSTVFYTLNLAKARDVAEDRAETSIQVLEAMSGLIAETYSELIETRSIRSADEQLEDEPLRLVLERTEKMIDSVISDDPAIRAELLLVQGMTNRELTRLDRARTQLDEALVLHRDAGNVNGTIKTLHELMKLETHLNKNELAREHLDAALELIESESISPALEADVYTTATHIETDLGNSEKALEFALQSIGILESLPGGPTTQLARAYVETASIYGRLEQRKELREWAQKSIDLYLELEGPMYRGLTTAYSALAYSYAIEGEYELAREFFSREVAVSRANYGEQSLKTAAGMGNLGIALRRLGRYDEAIDTCRRAEEILTSLPGDVSRNLASLYVNLGNTLRDVGRLADADATYQKGLAIPGMLTGVPRTRASLLNNSGELKLILGEFDEGESRLRAALDAKTQLYGADNISTARTMLLLVRAQVMSADITDASDLLDAAEKIYIDTYGPDHSKLGFYELMRGLYLRSIGRLAEARQRLQRAYQYRRDDYSEHHIDVLDVAFELVRTELMAGNLDAARRWLSSTKTGLEALGSVSSERTEADILSVELMAAEGNAAGAEMRRVEMLEHLNAYFPARLDWQRRLEGI